MDHQRPVLLDPARFKVLACGRRWGKTATGLQAVLRGHGPHRGAFRGAIDGGNIWWVAPTYKMANELIWEPLVKACRGGWTHKSELSMSIELPGGGRVTVRSADNPDSLRGAGLDGVVLDEAAFLKKDAWVHGLRPALADKQGWAMLLSTPNGRNWFYRAYRNAHGEDKWRAWKLPTSDNPLVTTEELVDLKKAMGPRAFAQEHMAEFMEVEGAMWPSSYFDDHIWVDRWPDKFEAATIGIDPSMGRTDQSDYQAATFVGLTGGLFYVDSLITRLSPGEFVERMIQFWQGHGRPNLAIETNGFQALYSNLFDLHCERLNLPPMPFFKINHSENKTVRIQNLDPHLANHKLRFRRTESNEMLVDQCMMFPLPEHHDDGPDALEMAIYLLEYLQHGGDEGPDDERD